MKPIKSTVHSFHCDSYQHMNNARYLELLEDARWQFFAPWFRDGYIERHNLNFLVVNINISYKYPAVPWDELETSVELDFYGRKTIHLKQEVYNRTADKLCAVALVTFVLYDKTQGKSLFITDEIKQRFNRLNGTD